MTTTFTELQIRLARQTVRMPDAILKVMGGMTRAEAEKILNQPKEA